MTGYGFAQTPATTPGQPAQNRSTESEIEFIKEYIKAFPSFESHYSRSHSSKKYLSSNLNIVKINDLYQEKCSVERQVARSISTFKT